jgi:flagellar assembly protein FliH
MENPTHVIPKEDMTPCQRWQLDSLDSTNTQDAPAPNQADKTNQKTGTSSSTKLEGKDPLTLPTTEQIEHIFQQAQEDGYSAGLQAGRSAGYQEGKQNAEAELKIEIKHIQSILSELDKELHQIDQQVAQDLLTLALTLSKKMITEALKIRPEFVLPIVQEAIRQLPHAAQHPHLYLHPDDALLVSNHLSDELSQSDWKICKDEKIDRGGCRVDAAGSEVDASLSTRWQRILATIGQENNWLE